MSKYDMREAIYSQSEGAIVPRSKSIMWPVVLAAVGVGLLVLNGMIEVTVQNGNMMENTAAFGVLSQFIGMTTDSRSFLSFVRHEYFRRVFCAWLAEKALNDEMPNDEEKLISIARAVCFENSAEYLGGIEL